MFPLGTQEHLVYSRETQTQIYPSKYVYPPTLEASRKAFKLTGTKIRNKSYYNAAKLVKFKTRNNT
jgi:hypothetical protein